MLALGRSPISASPLKWHGAHHIVPIWIRITCTWTTATRHALSPWADRSPSILQGWAVWAGIHLGPARTRAGTVLPSKSEALSMPQAAVAPHAFQPVHHSLFPDSALSVHPVPHAVHLSEYKQSRHPVPRHQPRLSHRRRHAAAFQTSPTQHTCTRACMQIRHKGAPRGRLRACSVGTPPARTPAAPPGTGVLSVGHRLGGRPRRERRTPAGRPAAGARLGLAGVCALCLWWPAEHRGALCGLPRGGQGRHGSCRLWPQCALPLPSTMHGQRR